MLRKLILSSVSVLALCTGVSSKDFNEKKIVLSLAAISDTHVNGVWTIPGYKFRSALIQERDMAGKSGVLDGVLVVGDLVDSPAWNRKKYTEVNDWKTLYERVFDPTEVPMVYTVGNHDVWREWTDSTYVEAKNISGRLGGDYFLTDVGDPQMREKYECRHCVIGGYHILCLTPNHRGPVDYPKESIEWLDAQLSEITAAEPGKYVIVLTHAMIYNTIYGSLLDDTDDKHPDYWSTKVLTDVLRKYPQAMVFGGHLHFPLNDPRSIWQGDFTVMGTASTRYMAIDNGNYENMAGRTVMKDKDEFSQGLLLQFDDKGNMRAVRMDFYNQTTIGEPWTAKHPCKDGSHLRKYNHGRLRSLNKAPVLDRMDVTAGQGRITVSFAAGRDDEFAHTYFITVKKDGEVVAAKKILSDFYRVPQASMMKKKWKQDIELAPGTYEVSLHAIDSWDAASNTITKTVSL